MASGEWEWCHFDINYSLLAIRYSPPMKPMGSLSVIAPSVRQAKGNRGQNE